MLNNRVYYQALLCFLLGIAFVIAGLLSSCDAGGLKLGDFRLLDVKDVYVDYMSFQYSNEPFLAPTYHAKDRVDLHLDLEGMNGILFLDNMIHSETDIAQYRLVGWNYRGGIHIGPFCDVFFEHYSMHLLDYVPQQSSSYDALGFRLYFYKKDK